MTKKSLILSLILFIFVFTNYYFSQSFNQSFFNIVYAPTDKNINDFLQKIKTSKYYSDQLNYFSTLNPKIGAIIIHNNEQKLNEIKKYNEFLGKNPNSRDILLKIAVLNLELGNTKEAEVYYKKAKQIDPEIFIKELES